MIIIPHLPEVQMKMESANSEDIEQLLQLINLMNWRKFLPPHIIQMFFLGDTLLSIFVVHFFRLRFMAEWLLAVCHLGNALTCTARRK